jgi:hypothetical protein
MALAMSVWYRCSGGRGRRGRSPGDSWARVSIGTQAEIEFFPRTLDSLEVGVPGDGEGGTS